MANPPDTLLLMKRKIEVARTRPVGFHSLKPRTRWHAATRMVLNNLSWITEDSEDDPTTTSDQPSNLITLLTRRRQRTGDIPIYEKALLRTPVEERDEHDREVLGSLFSGLRCFRRYPENVRRLMAGFVYFESYNNDRVICRENGEAEFLYFIVGGTMDLWRSFEDPIQGTKSCYVRSLTVGDNFGEMALFHNTPRYYTVTAKSVLEVLILKKRDFDHVLKASIMKSWDEIRSAMDQFPYFAQWGEVDRREACILSKIVHFEPGDTILGDGHGQSRMAYFMLSGRARLVQHLLLIPRKMPSGYVKYRCLPPGELSRSKASKPSKALPPGTETHFMQVALLSKGIVFGLGEDLEDRRVVAITAVSVLLMPCHTLHQHGHGNIWSRIRRFLDLRFPTQDALLRDFLNGRDWNAYRQDLVRDAMQGRPAVCHASLHDVPLSMRSKFVVPPEKHTCYELGRLVDPRAWRWKAARRERLAKERRVVATKREHRVELALKAKFEPQRGVKFVFRE